MQTREDRIPKWESLFPAGSFLPAFPGGGPGDFVFFPFFNHWGESTNLSGFLPIKASGQIQIDFSLELAKAVVPDCDTIAFQKVVCEQHIEVSLKISKSVIDMKKVTVDAKFPRDSGISSDFHGYIRLVIGKTQYVV